MNYESSQYKMKIVIDAVRNFVNTRQKNTESINNYMSSFKATKDVFLSHVGKDFTKLLKEDPDYIQIQADQTLSSAVIADRTAKAALKVLEEVITYLFMNNADQSKYGSLMARFNTTQSLGNSGEYPKTLVDAHTVLDAHNWDKEYTEKQKRIKNNERKEDEPLHLSFAQFKRGKCYCCGKTDHAYQDCNKRSTTTKDQWWISKQRDIQQYNQIISEIQVLKNTENNR